MIGAIIGDIIGSRFEWDNNLSKEFDLFAPDCFATDDSVLTLATAKSLIEGIDQPEKLNDLFAQNYQQLGMEYPDAGYGLNFIQWIYELDPKPYRSIGNGSAMRVSPCGWFAHSLEEAGELARKSAEVTHNHPEGMKGAEVIAKCIYLAKTGHSKEEILEEVKKYYPHDFLNSFNIDKIRETYTYDSTCPGSVPQAIEAFLEGEDYEDTIRNAISIGGDSDTIAAIAGSIAEAYFDIPEDIIVRGLQYLDEDQLKIVDQFYQALLRRDYGIPLND